MTDTNQQTPLPTLQPGDSHSESLIEAAIQGHADTREAMRWLVRQLVPATQPAEVTDAEQQAIDQIMEQAQVFASAWSLVGGRFDSGDALDDALDAKEELREMVARAILALRPVQSGLTGCNCRWDGDTQVQWCELHLAHKEAIHEWAERAKEAEKQLALRPVQVPMTDEQVDAFTVNGRLHWLGKRQLIRAVEAYYGITAQAKKEDE